MSPKLKEFLQRWLINTAGLLVAVHMIHIRGVHADGPVGIVIATFVLGILNAFLRPLLLLLSLPLLVLTLGLFLLVINAFLLYLVGSLLDTFHVDTFWAAFKGSLVMSVVALFLNSLTGSGQSRFKISRRPPPPEPPDKGGGPVIDV